MTREHGIQDADRTKALGWDTARVLSDSEMDQWQVENAHRWYDAELTHATDTWQVLLFADEALTQPVAWVQ